MSEVHVPGRGSLHGEAIKCLEYLLHDERSASMEGAACCTMLWLLWPLFSGGRGVLLARNVEDSTDAAWCTQSQSLI